jgi:hypothetical protein
MSQQQQQHPQPQSLPFSVNAEGQKVRPSYEELRVKALEGKGCPESQRLLGLMQQEMQQPGL